jgi:putative N6-adenine-specific DNA methylase
MSQEIDRMERNFNLARRIKRLVWSRSHAFFAVCPPGLEEMTQKELASLGVDSTPEYPGGLNFRARLETAYRLHLHSRLPGRLWLRLAEFHLRGPASFRRTLANLPWELFIPGGAFLRLQIEAGPDLHSGQLARDTLQGLNQRLESLHLAPGQIDAQAALRIMLRTRAGRCQLSLDLSGPPLYRRGYKLNPGPAPLRENLAAALLCLCAYDGSRPLLDPMSGSGSLALEAAQIALGLPPGGQRGFAVNDLPCHREAAWRYARTQALSAAAAILPAPIFVRDKASLALAKENARILGANFQLDLSGQLDWREEDFFTAPAPAETGVVVINPPYGVRLSSVRQAGRTSQRLARYLSRHYPGWRLGIVLYRPEWEKYFFLKDTHQLTVSHGGLKVTMLSGIVQ